MKVVASTSILSLLLANNVSAFAPSGIVPSSNRISSSIKAEVLDAGAGTTAAKIVPNEDLLKESKADNMNDEKWQIKVAEKKEEVAKVEAKVEAIVEDVVETKITDPKLRVQTGRYDDIEMSLAVPFLKRPSQLDGTHAGDIGFDPLGLSESNDMYTMMEAEIRHSRLAMLAVIGWPLSELLAPNFMLQGPNHLAPSVLNGFNPLSFLVTAAIFGGIGFLEYTTALRPTLQSPIGKKHAEDMKDVWNYGVPGDYNFDPLNLYSAFGDDAVGRKAMRELEVAHGRGAMMGISYFALWEYLTGHPIVENNMLFSPNAFVPFLGLLYISFGFFFDIKSSDQYLLQIELNSEGDMRLTRLKNFLRYAAQDAKANAKIAKEKSDELIEFARDARVKYDKITERYTDYTMRNID